MSLRSKVKLVRVSKEVAATVWFRAAAKGFHRLDDPLGEVSKDSFGRLGFPPLGVPYPHVSLSLGSSVLPSLH